MEPWLMTVLLFGLLIVGLLAGLPIAFTLGGVGVVFTYILIGANALAMPAQRLLGDSTNFVLIALPLFVLMANFLEVTGMADDMFGMMYRWVGNIPGGLASGTIIICAIFAAMAGISGVATITMGLIAIPSMLKRSYNTRIALGTVAAGGALGILIPPSIIAVLYGAITGTSVGGLFMGCMIPGILLSALFIVYITLRAFIQKDLAPRTGERFGWHEKIISLKGVYLPMILIVLVLGTIYTGVCTPTESAAFGAFGAMISCIIKRRLTWQAVRVSTLRTLRVTVMCVWIVFGASCFNTVYDVGGGSEFMLSVVGGLDIPPIAMIGLMMFVYIVLGCFIDPVGMCMITVPVFLPIVETFGYSPIWFGVLFIVNCEMAYITPPFGFNLFYIRSIAPKHVSTSEIYRSILPFVLLQFVCLVLVILFPQLALWLPSFLIK